MLNILGNTIFLLVTTLLIGFSLAGYLGEFNQYLELTSHFKVQYFLLTLIPVIFFTLKRYRLGLILSLFCLLINLVEIAPWYLPHLFNPPVAAGETIRVLLSNIDKYNAQYPQVIAMVQQENPDIAVLLEVGKDGVKQLESLREQFPYFMAHQDVDIDGTAIYSKLPLLNPTVQSLGGGRKAVLADITSKNQSTSIIAVHPSNAVGKAYVEECNRQLMAIADYVRGLKQSVVLIGDLNTTMWSPYYKRSIGTTQLRNTRSGFGILPTWKIIHPFFAIPIDHCLVTPDIQVISLHTGRPIGSDHLPLITELRLPSVAK